MCRRLLPVIGLFLTALLAAAGPGSAQALNPNPPDHPVKLIFIHHSTGEGWLVDETGGLGQALTDNNYYVSDTNYGWGPSYSGGDGTIGDHTDIGNWYDWFLGASSATYLSALYGESGENSSYTRMADDPGGENEIIMFKSCFPNSYISGNPGDAPLPTSETNPIYSQGAGDSSYTVANVKGLYRDLLAYFAAHQDKLFILISSPPLIAVATDATHAANARAVANWLVTDWLASYPHANVRVFDYFNVLTSNGGSRTTNDLGRASGNHHRYWNSAIQHIQTVASNYGAYGSGDSHPTAAGQKKATGEYVPLLNIWYNAWKGIPGPTLTVEDPASGATWYIGETQTITWSATGTQDANVSLQLFKGTTKVLDVSRGTANDGSFDWTLPRGLSPASNYRLRVTTLDKRLSDDSDLFAIAKPTIVVTAPAGAAVWGKGTAQTITWVKAGPQDANVSVTLLRSGTKVLVISPGSPNNGGLAWTVPASLAGSTAYKVRVTTLDNLIKGTSAAFTIR